MVARHHPRHRYRRRQPKHFEAVVLQVEKQLPGLDISTLATVSPKAVRDQTAAMAALEQRVRAPTLLAATGSERVAAGFQVAARQAEFLSDPA
jgi:hypothetical protein